MPLVLAHYDPGELGSDDIGEIAAKLPELVAKHLSVPGTGAELTAADVEVWVNPSGEKDVNTKDLEIIVFAGLYPERQVNLDERRSALAKDLRELMKVVFEKEFGARAEKAPWTGFVWILLVPSSFEEL